MSRSEIITNQAPNEWCKNFRAPSLQSIFWGLILAGLTSWWIYTYTGSMDLRKDPEYQALFSRFKNGDRNWVTVELDRWKMSYNNWNGIWNEPVNATGEKVNRSPAILTWGIFDEREALLANKCYMHWWSWENGYDGPQDGIYCIKK